MFSNCDMFSRSSQVVATLSIPDFNKLIISISFSLLVIYHHRKELRQFEIYCLIKKSSYILSVDKTLTDACYSCNCTFLKIQTDYRHVIDTRSVLLLHDLLSTPDGKGGGLQALHAKPTKLSFLQSYLIKEISSNPKAVSANNT